MKKVIMLMFVCLLTVAFATPPEADAAPKVKFSKPFKKPFKSFKAKSYK